MHGEYIFKFSRDDPDKGSPPYARGILSHCHGWRDKCRITPVCTGNTYAKMRWSNRFKDHPRMHGEYYMSLLGEALRPGSPPYARGIPPFYLIASVHL